MATLGRGGEPGPRSATILLKVGGATIAQRVVEWEVDAPLSAYPKTIVMAAGKVEYTLRVRSADRRPFRVTAIDPGATGLRGDLGAGGPAASHELKLTPVPSGKVGGGRSALIVHTDHPGQPVLEVAVISID